MLTPSTDIRFIKGVGEKRAGLFAKLGVFDVDSLLRLYPRAYEDWSRVVSIRNAPVNENCCIKACIGGPIHKHLIRKGLTLYKTEATDGESVMRVTIFNNKYLAEKLVEGDEYLFFGKLSGEHFCREMSSPSIVKAETGERIRPIYPQTEALSSRTIEATVIKALNGVGDSWQECIPESVRKANGLYTALEALREIHSPTSEEKMLAARRTLAFEELYVLQTGLLLLRGRSRSRAGATLKKDFSEQFFSILPFVPTNAQRRAVAEAIADMMSELPMNRLLQGDVGSGKTAVAATLIFSCAQNFLQSALMAPTEILVQQHYNTLKKLLDSTGLTVAMLVGSTPKKQKDDIKRRLAEGEIDVLIGTHALIQDDVVFKNLGLVITDEQHRFGVRQRAALGSKGHNPHVLVMSATPIPRTLALMIYGDLDISVLDELPPGRQKIETYCVESRLRERAYTYIKKHLDEGRQGYIVCPLVEESDALELAAAEKYAEELEYGSFEGYSVGLLHGKMKPKDKEKVMAAFVSGKTQLLVSTTVIEVGVDVPNAVIMLIENAERFGLSQLHQLRGRIGRGEYKSTCILITDAQNEATRRRTEVMCRTTNGFEIADEDLKLRGPGDFFGSRQHGLPEMKIADLVNDMQLLKLAQFEAKRTLEKDRRLSMPENSVLKAKILKLFESPGTMN